MEFVTRKNATLPILKMQIVKDGRDSYEDFMSFIETSTIYFSMQNIETGVMKINTKFAGFVEKIFDDPNAKPEYYVYYKFTKNETNKPGRYEGQFLFKNEQGSLILPIREKLLITIKDSLLEDDLDYNECFTGKFQCCVIGPPGPLLPTELTLSATYSSGSIVADYTLTANQGVDARTSISFTNTLGTITGDSIQIVTGVTISRGQTTSGSSVTVDGDFSNLDFTSFFSNITVLPSTINLDTELLVSENFGDALSANCYCYLFTNTSTKSATLKFEPCSGGKVTSILGPLQSAYQCIKKYGYSISASVTATLQQQCNFPDYECGPPPSATPTPTPTQTPTQTPTPTITPTITLTMTRTPTVTPTQTLLPFISGCPIFFASKFNSNLYQYNLVSNTLTYINLSNDYFCLEAAASGIANRFYELISDGGLSQYPVVRYWNWDYETRTIYSGPIDAEVPNSTYNGEIGLGLAPTLDGEKVYISQYGWNSNSNIQTVLLFDLTGTTELFDLVENRYVIDMTRNSTDSLFLLTRGSSQIWIEQWETDDTSAGSSKIFEFPVFSNSQTEESSIFVDSGNLYMLQYGYPDHAVYQISNIPPYEITYINGFSIVPQVIAGAAAFPECSVFDFTKLIVNIQSVYSVNSSSVTYNLTFNYPINEDLTIGFTDTIGVYSGSPIVVTTGVTVSASAITGTTTVVIGVDFNNLSRVSTFSGYSFTPYYYSGAVTITDTDVFPTPTPTVTKTKTPTPTITKTVTKTPTLTPTPTFNCFCYSVTNNISGTSEIAYLTCSGEEGFFYLNTLGETVKLCVVQNGIAVALGSATISLEGSCLDGFCPTPTPTPTKTSTVTPTLQPQSTPTVTPTNTQTPTKTSTVTPSNTPTKSNTPTITVTKTNTPTPTSTPICSCFSITNISASPQTYSGFDCNGNGFISASPLNPGESITICSRTITSNANLSIVNQGACISGVCPTPTPTPTKTKTPTITPTNTPTITNTPTNVAVGCPLVIDTLTANSETTIYGVSSDLFNPYLYLITISGADVYDSSYTYIDTISLEGIEFDSVYTTNMVNDGVSKLFFAGGVPNGKNNVVLIYDYSIPSAYTFTVGLDQIDLITYYGKSNRLIVVDNSNGYVEVYDISDLRTPEIYSINGGTSAVYDPNLQQTYIVSQSDTMDVYQNPTDGFTTVSIGNSGYYKQIIYNPVNLYLYILSDGLRVSVYDDSSFITNIDFSSYLGVNKSMSYDTLNDKLYVLNIDGSGNAGLIKIDCSTDTIESFTNGLLTGITDGKIYYDETTSNIYFWDGVTNYTTIICTTTPPTPSQTPTNTPTPSPTIPLQFISTWSGSSVTLPYSSGGTYSGTIYWGDGTSSVNSYVNRQHTYPSGGTYTITIVGEVTGFGINNAPGEVSKIRSITKFGSLRGLNNSNADMFYACDNLILTNVQDTMNMVGITATTNMFSFCDSLTTISGMNSWNMTSVTNMTGMFFGSESFNQDISNWDVSNVTSMSQLFYGTTSFNQPLSGWNVSNVTSMGEMFNGASSFNRDLSNWCVSLIPTKPANFDLGASSWTGGTATRPQWGTCPGTTPTPTPTRTITPTVTPTITSSQTPTPTRTITPSLTASITPTNSITPTRTITPSITPSITLTRSVTPTRTITPSITVTKTQTPSPTPLPVLVYDLDAANYSAMPTNGSTISGTGAYTITVTNAGGSISWSGVNGGIFVKSNNVGTDVMYGGPNYVVGQSYTVFMAYKISPTSSGRLLNTQSEASKDWLMGVYNGFPNTFYPNFSVNLPSSGADTVWHLDWATWDTSTSTGKLYTSTNTAPSNFAYSVTNASGGGFNQLRLFSRSAGSEVQTASIGFVKVWNGELTLSQIQSLHATYKTRFGY